MPGPAEIRRQASQLQLDAKKVVKFKAGSELNDTVQ
jgi:nucleoid DNA-binding protein